MADVIRQEVERFLESAEGPFDKREIELKILSTPEYRRIHEVQMSTLTEIDIMTPLELFMRGAVRARLQALKSGRGDRLLEAIPNGSGYTWYPLMKLRAPMLARLVGEWASRRDYFQEKTRIGEKLLVAVGGAGPQATVSDVYDRALSMEERATLSDTPPMLLKGEAGKDEER